MNDDFGLVRIPANSRVGGSGVCPSGEVPKYDFVSGALPCQQREKTPDSVNVAAKVKEVPTVLNKIYGWLLVALIVVAVLFLIYWDTRV